MKRNRFWRIFFHADTLTLACGAVLLWFTITLLYDQFTDFSSLKKHTGIITRSAFVVTRIKDKPFFKDTTREMRLFLNDEPDYYSIVTSKPLPAFDSLFWGDTVHLYTKDKWLWLFGLPANKIVHLERVSDRKIFLDYEKGQRSGRGLYLITAAGTLLLFWLYVWRTRRRLSRE